MTETHVMRGVLDPVTGKAADEHLDDLATELPSVNAALTKVANHYPDLQVTAMWNTQEAL
ncbi:hypothetical protein [Nonomuraea lactucae]|uniref:hypothetical protein n=1 Tax=Nonomuraea lactucae TaxID=2249762 RepID=UPI0013B42C95|nr:hypothetical protein [Nonomuraea lactucae]